MSGLLRNGFLKKEISKAILSQQKWRNKQIKIFFQDGRPIFGKFDNGILIKPRIENIKFL